MFPWTSDDGFAVVDHRAGQPGARHLGRRRRAGGRPRADVRLRGQPHLEQQPVVHRLAGRRPGVRRLLPRARPRLRRLPGRPAADLAAVPRVRRARTGRRPGPGRRSARTRSTSTSGTRGRCSSSPTCCSATSPAARRRSGSTPSASCGRSPAPPACTCRRPTPSSSCGGRWSTTWRPGARLLTETNVPHAREHLLLRRRHRRGAPRLPVRAAAAGAALLRLRLAPPGSARGRPASGRSATRRPGSTSWPATTASGCGRPRASSTTHEREALVERTRSHGGGSRGPAGRTAAGRSTSSTSATSTRCAPPTEARDPAVLAAKALAAHSILLAFLGVPGDLLPLAGRLAARPRGHGEQRDQPPDQPRRARRRPARDELRRRPAPPRGVRRDAAPARRTPAAPGVLAVRHPAGRASSTTGSSRCAAAPARTTSCCA